MSQKIFSETGRLNVYAGDQPKQWELRDAKGKVYFTGTAEELDVHTKAMLEQGIYLYSAKRGRHKV